ncbi:MAG TPA: hypothetical protein VJU17_01885 [Gemmatimonadales bacterium]|nr:hypothetical protein [Gemmatimonadales bacterium]
MTKRGRMVTLLLVVLFGAFLLWSTLASQHVECTVVVAFAKDQGSGTASAASRDDAIREAQTVACGPLTQGMNDRIACSRVPPVSTRCRTL